MMALSLYNNSSLKAVFKKSDWASVMLPFLGEENKFRAFLAAYLEEKRLNILMQKPITLTNIYFI